MRWKETVGEDATQPRQKPFDGVPAAVSDAFFRGLDDVKHGRTVSISSALAEGRRRIAEYRANKNKNSVNDPLGGQRQ